MMTDALNGTQAEALAVLVRTLRPEWDVPGVKAALFKARDRGNAFEVIHAALYAAEDLANRTPAIIALAGPHWTRGRELGSSNPRGEKCAEIGHEGKPAHNCSYCIADRKARDDEAPLTHQDAPDEERQDIYARGRRRVDLALELARRKP